MKRNVKRQICPVSVTVFGLFVYFRNVKRVLFVPYALHDRDAYTKTARDKFKTLGRFNLQIPNVHVALFHRFFPVHFQTFVFLYYLVLSAVLFSLYLKYFC